MSSWVTLEVLKCSHGLYGMYAILKLQMRRLNPIKFCHVIFLIFPKILDSNLIKFGDGI